VATLQSVSGPIDSESLGLLLVHEHLKTTRENIAVQFPHLFDPEEEFATTCGKVAKLRSFGVEAICDPAVMGIGRDVRFMQRVSEGAGLTVFAATGIHTPNEIPPYMQVVSIDAIADLFIHDIEVGIQNTQIRAAFLKVVTEQPGVTENIEKLLRAVARAHLRTGVPIMTHSYAAGETGLRQQDILADEGVDLQRVQIGHSGDSKDLTYLCRLLDRGSYLGMDRYGLELILSTEDRNATVIELCNRGYADRLMLGQDSVCIGDRQRAGVVPPGTENWTNTYLFEEVIPMLRESGLSEAALDAMLWKAPRSWLCGTAA
jgi:phosphotriesterase-related protein